MDARLSYDMYTQIGIVTLIGLAAKNAILIVEYARMSHEEGKSIVDAAMEAARLRLRPILMTSFAFILGVVPLALAVGRERLAALAGDGGFRRHERGTLLAVFIVPVLYVVSSAQENGKSHDTATPLACRTIGSTDGSVCPPSWAGPLARGRPLVGLLEHRKSRTRGPARTGRPPHIWLRLCCAVGQTLPPANL